MAKCTHNGGKRFFSSTHNISFELTTHKTFLISLPGKGEEEREPQARVSQKRKLNTGFQQASQLAPPFFLPSSLSLPRP